MIETTLSPFFAGQTLVAFDTETTGLWAPSHRLVEIAGVKFRLGQPEPDGFFQALINPLMPIPKEATRVHGLDNGMIALEPPSVDVLPKFLEFCGPNSILIAHNAPFDMSFLVCELGRHRLPMPANPFLDTVNIFRRHFPGLPSYSLLYLVKTFGIADNQLHRALADSEFVRYLMNLAAPQFGFANSLEELQQLMAVLYLNQPEIEVSDLPEAMSDIVYAVEAKSLLEIEYHAAGATPGVRTVRPLHFFQRRSIYYLTAFCTLVNAERTFRIDRIRRCRRIDD